MMGPLAKAMPTPRALLLAIALLLGGCGSLAKAPNLLYLSVGVNPDQAIDAEVLTDTRQRLDALKAGYRQLHPQTHFQFSLYPEQQLATAIRRRSRAGLGPDLLLVNGDTALQLLAAGLVEPFPAGRVNLKQFRSEELQRVRGPGGALAGLPLLVQTQVACFNRRRLKRAPATLDQLLAASAAGHPVGLSMEGFNLFWSVGSLGALEGFNQAIAGQDPTTAQRQGLTRWLAWLQSASAQQRVTFYPSQPTAEAEFRAGRLDWLPCRSTAVPQLRQALGPALGVAPLPSGPGGDSTPINRLRVLALGTSSSPKGRERALAFSRFSVNPLSQRNLTLGSQVVLPANRFVKVPVASSGELEAMVTSAQQGSGTNRLLELMHSNDPRVQRIQTLLTELVFGETPPPQASQALIAILRDPP